MGLRFTILITLISGAYLFLVFNLYQIQLSGGGASHTLAASGFVSSQKLKALRGTIFFTDKSGARIEVATNKDFPVIFAVPKEIEDVSSTIAAISGPLGMTPDELSKKFAKKDSYELLLKKASSAVAGEIQSLDLKGIYTTHEPFRFYSFGNFASQILGFVGMSEHEEAERGKYGLEKMYDEALSGMGSAQSELDSAAAGGADVHATIDVNIQKEAERLLDESVKKTNAEGGSIIVEDPKTGKILALANDPSFDPNSYGDVDVATFLNPTTQEAYEPGSVFKIITMAAGIDSGKITPLTTYNDTGSLSVSGKTIKNWDHKAHGLVTMTNVIEQSLNTGAAFAERQTGDAIFTSYVKKFGFGVKSGVDMPGELAGNLGNITSRYIPPIAFASASFGQGITVTPIQMINAFAAIANGGNLMRPYLNDTLAPHVVSPHIITAATAKKIIAMMVSAVDKNIIAKVPGYAVAGKTGTAQVAARSGKGYVADAYINTFIGFAPASDPKFVILVRLIKPEGAALAGTTVVPTFQQLAQFLVNYYAVAPDRIENKQ